jgi:hypothetical protein
MINIVIVINCVNLLYIQDTKDVQKIKHSHYRPMGEGEGEAEGSGRLRLQDSVTSALEGGWLSVLRTGCLNPQDYPGTHFKSLS